MSDYIRRFIPVRPSFKLSEKEISEIKTLDWCGENVKFEANDDIRFADAGSNFESVSCPFCGFGLEYWWGAAMNRAYNDEKGFTDIAVTTPCCNKISTLHDLNYYFPQGFYKSIVEELTDLEKPVDENEICADLNRITNEKWRIILSHY